MPEDDIVLKIGVDTTELDSGMARVKQAAGSLGGVAASPAFDPIAAHVERYQNVPKENASVLAQTAGAARNLASAQEELASASSNAGNAFEALASRMVMRLGIFYVIHEAIKAITAALHETVAYEQARVRFESLSTAIEGAATSWGHLRSLAHETGIPVEQLASAQESLEKMGVSASSVGADINSAARYAKILGEDVNTIAQEIGRVELKKGSIQDMQDLAYATQNTSLQRMVNDLAEAQRMAPVLAEQQAQLDRQINRAADDQDRALNRQIEDTERLRNAQVGVAQAMGLAGKAFQEHMGGGRAGGPAGQMTERLKAEMALGEQQLAREGEPSARQMRAAGMSGREVYQVLMQAAQRYHEQERTATQRQEEDQKRLREQAQEVARENVRLKAAYDLIAAENQVALAVKQSTAQTGEFAAAMGTAAGQGGLITEHLAEAVQDSQTLLDTVKGWNTAALNFVDSIGKIKTELNPVVELAQQLAGFIGQAVQEIGKITGFDPKKPPTGATTVWSPTHQSPADILRSMPFGIGQLALPQGGGQHPVVEKLNEQDKQHSTTHGLLKDMRDILHNAFGP